MTDRTTQKRRKLSHEILGLLAAAFGISLFLFAFLSLTASSLAEGYLDRQGIFPTEGQLASLDTWITSLSLLTAVLFFVVLFLFLLGQKMAYIPAITRGVEALQAQQMDYLMPLEGNNELTQLAETINYLSATQRTIKERERAMREEREQLIRTLSHDIRTPLTSILAYAEFLSGQEGGEDKEHLALIRKKAEQIKELTDILLDGGKRNPESFADARLLMEQLAAEAEESLEDTFAVSTDLSRCPAFPGTFDVGELRRIFDNLVSNIQKYADPARPVTFQISVEEGELVIRQENAKGDRPAPRESHQMGLNSIRRIAHSCGGRVEVRQEGDRFSITIVLSEI